MSIVTYDGITSSVNVPQDILDAQTYIASAVYPADLNPIIHTYVTSTGTGFVESKEEKQNKDKGETNMPTFMESRNIVYSLIRETPIFNAEGSIKKVVFSGPATIVIWNDGTKTVVKCMEGDDYDPEKGLMMCIMEKLLGGKPAVKKLFKKHIPEEDTASIIEAVSHALDELKYSFLNLNLPTDHKEESKE